MAVVTGNDYDHIDIVNGNTQTRHMIKDASARVDISDLKSAFADTGLQKITEPPYITQGYINTSNNQWGERTSGNNRCGIYPVKSGYSVSVTANTSYDAYIAALKTFSNPSDGNTPDFSSSIGWTGTIKVGKGTTFAGSIPSDANYLYVWIGNVNTKARLPVSIIVDGYDCIQSAYENLIKRAPVDSPTFTGTPRSVTPPSNNNSQQIATTEFVKSVSLILSQHVPQMVAGENIDNLLTSGCYRVISSTIAGQIEGAPPTRSAAYKLIVSETTQAGRVYQFALVNSAVFKIAYRYYNGTAWTAWKEITIDFNTFSHSKNLLPISSYTEAIQGVNTLYHDGILTLSGTASNSGGKSKPLTETFKLPAGTYTLSLSYINTKALNTFLRDTDGNDLANVHNILEPVTFSINSEKVCYVSVNVTGGKEYSSQKFKIQLESGNVQTAFESPDIQTTIDEYAREANIGILSAFTNIECIGDSLTYGAVYTSDSNYRQAHKPYPVVLGHIVGANMSYLATPGSNASEWWAEYKDLISAKTNALAIIFLGTNGGLTDTISTDVSGNNPEQWANTHTGNYARIINAYKTAGYKVALVKCFMTSSSANIDTTNSVIQQMADRFECGLIENDYMDNISYHYTPDKTYANTLHYNDLGYAAMAYRIVENVSHMSETFRANIIPN